MAAEVSAASDLAAATRSAAVPRVEAALRAAGPAGLTRRALCSQTHLARTTAFEAMFGHHQPGGKEWASPLEGRVAAVGECDAPPGAVRPYGTRGTRPRKRLRGGRPPVRFVLVDFL